ncbi:methyl-accepting chemotaxis protein [Pseudanabaena sp. ABRG5-3]|uniref:methyl-accepting chemotaxis protein n=1 Tax=Pseudanabaena sp. ABRG5-3 TaxID=685565 RepID=UPI000F823FBC|nr:methyl-accepting chemotaxis protein [Pseudanabaena sp. ABRG5-3]
MASTPKTKTATSVGKSAQETSKRSPKSPAPKQSKPKGSLGLGLLLIAIGTSLIGLGGLGYLFYQELLSSSKREVDRSAESQTQQIAAKLDNVRQSTDGVANAAKALSQQAPKPKTVEQYQKLLLDGVQRSEQVAGIGIVQNENLLFAAPKPTVPYVLKEKSGLKLAGSAQKLATPNDKLFAGNRSDAQNIPPYKSPITKVKESWSESYSALGKTVITYSAPIVDGQKVLGVVNADAIASNLVTVSTSPNSDSKIGFVVVSASGKVITASDQFQETQGQNPATAEALKNLVQQSSAQAAGIAQVGGNLWAYRKIDGTDWVVATYLPEAEITNKLLVLVGGAAIGISAILAIAILGFINSLKKRLQPLTEECDRFLSQQGANNVNLAGKDEIDRLSLSLKSTLQKAKTNEVRLRSEATQSPSNLDDTTSAQMQQSVAERELMEAEVGDLLDVVSSMEEGDLTIEAQVNDRATGLVADTLNRLREKLVEIISRVLGTAQQVAQGASDLEEMARTVVLNTAEQAQSVAQGQALTAQVAVIAQRSSEQISVANQSLQEVRNTVTSGQTAIDNLTESISVLQTGSAQIVQRMKTLGEFVGLAEQFVQDQGQIAQQTQVLALNATLVAASAVEQKDPKQFAGVARQFESIAVQVNDLATQTNQGLTVLQNRTSQIQTVVTAIDAEVQNLSGLVAGFTTGVQSSQSAFQSIQVATEEVVQIGQTITESSIEITEVAESTASYISEIAQLADRTAELTRAARQQAEAMGNQAQQLLQGIQFFRLPASTGLPNSGDYAVNPEVNAFTDSPDTSINSLVDVSTESNDTEANNNIVVPAIALATVATAVAISHSGQDAPAEYHAPTEEQVDNTVADSQYLESLLDDGIDDEFSENDQASYAGEMEAPQEQNFAAISDNFSTEQSDLHAFVDTNESDNALTGYDDTPIQSPETAYAELTDISVIEKSLLDDLRQEIYEDFVDDDTPLTTDLGTETEATLKNPMEGVDEFAIAEASSDPIIVSATSSFMEDTAFGIPLPLSEEALANLPTSVDFTIPDLDDHDFEIPKMDIQSTLDNSNSFFDADSVQSVENLESNVTDFDDPFAMEQTTGTSDDAINDDVFAQDLQDVDISDHSDYSDGFDSNQSDDYNNYVSNQEFNDSLESNFESTSNEDFGNAFDTSFDESPFDPEFGEALTISNGADNQLDQAFDNSYDNFTEDVSYDLDAYAQEDENNQYEIEQLHDIPNDLVDANITNAIESTNAIDIDSPDNLAGLPNQIPDIYLEELSDEALSDEDEFAFDFPESLSVTSNYESEDLGSSNFFNEPNLTQDGVDFGNANEEFVDPFDINNVGISEDTYQEEDNFALEQNYLFTEPAIAPISDLQNAPVLETPVSDFSFGLEEDLATSSDDFSDQLNDDLNDLDGLSDLSVSDLSENVESSHEFFDNSISYQNVEESTDQFADPFAIDEVTPEEDAFGAEIAIASDADLQNLPALDSPEYSLELPSTEFAFELEDDSPTVVTSFDELDDSSNIFDGSTLLQNELDATNYVDDTHDFEISPVPQEENIPEASYFDDLEEESSGSLWSSDAIAPDLAAQEDQDSFEFANISSLDESPNAEFEFPDFSELTEEVKPDIGLSQFTQIEVAISEDLSEVEQVDIQDDLAEQLDLSDSSSPEFEFPDFSEILATDDAQLNEVNEGFSVEVSNSSNNFDDLDSFPSLDDEAVDSVHNLLSDELSDEESDVSLLFNNLSIDSANDDEFGGDDASAISQDQFAQQDNFDISEEGNTEYGDEYGDSFADGFAESLETSTGLLDLSETSEETQNPSATLELEDAAIFDTLADDLDAFDALDAEFPENSLETMTDAVNSEFLEFSGDSLNPSISEISETDALNLEDGFTELSDEDSDTSMNWLDELTVEEEDNTGAFADLSIDQFSPPTNNFPDLSADPFADSSYGFADNLLDSLMEESDQEVANLSTDFPDLSMDVDLSSSNLPSSSFPSVDTLSAEESDDSESEFDFDFGAFDDFDDDSNVDASIGNTNNATISARAEIEDFLSGALGIEEFTDDAPNSATTESDRVIPNKPDAKSSKPDDLAK